MLSPVSHATQAQPQAASQTIAVRQPAQSIAQVAPTDKVTFSAAASLRQELTETSIQTAREAGRGDIQAQNLLAREAADKTGSS